MWLWVRFGGTGSNCKRWRLGHPAYSLCPLPMFAMYEQYEDIYTVSMSFAFTNEIIAQIPRATLSSSPQLVLFIHSTTLVLSSFLSCPSAISSPYKRSQLHQTSTHPTHPSLIHFDSQHPINTGLGKANHHHNIYRFAALRL